MGKNWRTKQRLLKTRLPALWLRSPVSYLNSTILTKELQTPRSHALFSPNRSPIYRLDSKNMRLQLEDAEAQVSALQTKHKKATLQLEEAEERCETAEGALQNARQRAKSQAQSLAATRGPSVGASRQRSRMRTPAAQD